MANPAGLSAVQDCVMGYEMERTLTLGTDGEERDTARKKNNSSQAICPVTQFPPPFPFNILILITVHYVELRNPSQDWASIMCRLKGD